MIRKLLLPFILLLSIQLQAQNLKNTIWLGTKPPSPNMWFKYDADTVSYTMSGINGVYTPLGIYTASNGLFSAHDLSGTVACTTPGQYNYSVYLSQLTFTLISDNCTSRASTLVNYTWTLMSGSTATGLAEQSPLAISTVYQGEGKWQLIAGQKGTVRLADINGKFLMEKQFEEGSNTLDLGSLAPGIYIAICVAGNQSRAVRLVR